MLRRVFTDCEKVYDVARAYTVDAASFQSGQIMRAKRHISRRRSGIIFDGRFGIGRRQPLV